MNHFKECSAVDFDAIVEILDKNALPTSDISLEKQKFWKFQQNGKLHALAGIEKYGTSAIFRSFVVDESLRGTGLGYQLYNYTLEMAREEGVNKLFLLTTTAKDWFLRQSWQIIERSDVPESIANSEEFKSICPSTATCMFLEL